MSTPSSHCVGCSGRPRESISVDVLRKRVWGSKALPCYLAAADAARRCFDTVRVQKVVGVEEDEPVCICHLYGHVAASTCPFGTAVPLKGFDPGIPSQRMTE